MRPGCGVSTTHARPQRFGVTAHTVAYGSTRTRSGAWRGAVEARAAPKEPPTFVSGGGLLYDPLIVRIRSGSGAWLASTHAVGFHDVVRLVCL